MAKPLARSPLAPETLPRLPKLPGMAIRTVHAGYKYRERSDLTLMTFEEGTAVAGVLTRSKCPSPEVERCRLHLAQGLARAVVVNAGNSNAFTGAKGRAATDFIVRTVADELDCPEERVFVASTGVIGEPLPIDKAEAGLRSAFSTEEADWVDAARAIGTTDTFPKLAVATAIVGGERVTVCGIAKGSGMIAPDMATMLAFIATDAAVAPGLLQTILSDATERTFNMTTVDGDTSTSDTLLAFATGRTGPRLSSMTDGGADALAAAIHQVCHELAVLVVKDGEGASKFITIDVTGAETDVAAKRIGMSIANSPLVKTAIAGEDANWGRVVMAVGKAGEAADRDRLSISFGGIEVAREGRRVDGYDEAPVARHLKGDAIDVAVDLGLGNGRARVWTCDLTHGYISINADYRS